MKIRDFFYQLQFDTVPQHQKAHEIAVNKAITYKINVFKMKVVSISES